LTIETDEIEKSMLPLFRYADAVAVPTRFGQKVLREKTGCAVEFLPYGVDDCFRRLPDDERLELRKARNCSDKIRFITVAQNTARKNLPALLQAVSLIRKDDPNGRMQFYVHTNADACDRQEASMFDLRLIADRLGVSDRVVFPESVSLFAAPDDETLVREYNASDFFVTPSNSEGFGLPIVEAMACGLPVLANGAFVMSGHLGSRIPSWQGFDSEFGPTERGWAVENRLEIFPRYNFAKIIEPKALGQALVGMTSMPTDDVSKMRENSVKYAKEHRWEDMKKGLCGIVEGTNGPVSIPVEILEGNEAGMSY
jgi:glycosyltransferase involved in cell wall biosynthesis